MNEWLIDNLVCPRDKGKLQLSGDKLICPENHDYPIIENIPTRLLEEERIHGSITRTLENVARIKETDASKNESFAPLWQRSPIAFISNLSIKKLEISSFSFEV